MDDVVLMEKISERERGIRELIGATGWKPARVLVKLSKLEREGLVESKLEAPHGPGRPRRIVRLTKLGEKYLATFRECERLRLRTSLFDVKKAVRQAKEVEALVRSGRSAYQMLWELDEIVRAVRNSAKAA
ncbi:MAG: hypothetical protein QW179_04245 [Candidatus Hadarchaeales archaeon]